MTTLDLRSRLLAVLLSALAGFVDAIGFLELGGLFVSFMTGNSTRLGVFVAEASREALVAVGLIASFVAGVALGTVIGRAAGGQRRRAILACVAALLLGAGILGILGAASASALLLALAMGAENAIFEADGEVRVGLTYMTGTLVKLGQRLAGALTKGPTWGWPLLLLLWLGLVQGAVLGALAYRALGPASLWVAAGLAGLLALTSPPAARAEP
jgi:uncharacterized membrane protein YoaK (UPF0700 family)